MGGEGLAVGVEVLVAVELVVVGLLVDVGGELAEKLIALPVPIHVVLLAVFVDGDLDAGAALGSSLDVVGVTVGAIDGTIVRVLGEDGPAEAASGAALAPAHELRRVDLVD